VSRVIVPDVVVGNDFVLPKRQIRVVPTIVAPQTVVAAQAAPALDGVVFEFEKMPYRRRWGWLAFIDLMHRYSLGAFALLLLLVVSSATQVGGAYLSAQYTFITPTSGLRIPPAPLKGPNMVIATPQLTNVLSSITDQTIVLTIGDKQTQLSPEIIKSWLQIVNDKRGATYIHVKKDAITNALTQAAAPFITAPVSQVVATHADGSTHTIASGKNGTQLGDIKPAVQQIGQYLLSGKGFQLNLPVTSLAFTTVSPSAFDKLLEVNVSTKQMWAYDKGVLTRSFPISAGAPATPTPIGQYKIYSKLPVQDMRGYNADGTKYFQPHVRWVNYFLPGGYAVHGNYWRPLSWFGAINSSHGCVSLPDYDAKWIYDWAPIGTTVITHF
jgi:hypothetical protein